MNDPTTMLQSDGAPRTLVPRGAAERFAPGTLIASRYRIVALLGRGGMGEVYRADDIRLDQQVALKFLPPRLESNAEALERFFAEIRLGRQVSHPNVCRLYDIGEHEGHQFIAMEYVDGEDLASLLKRIGKLPAQKAIDIARDVAAGLAAAHAAGIVHRDLKPSNVMIDGRGRARITDFGLAMIDAESGGEERIIGTPAYMAPEQFSGASATPRSDVYAFGLILYECLTGNALHGGASGEEIIRRRIRDTSSGSLTRTPDTEPAIDRLLRRCLDPDPLQRPASARVVLGSLPGGDPLAAALAAGETPSPELVAAAEGRGELSIRTAWTMLALLLTSAIAVAAMSTRTMLHSRLRGLRAPEGLAERASEIATSLGAAPARDSRWWLRWDQQQWSWLRQHRSVDVNARPTPLRLAYRSSPEPLAARGLDSFDFNDPPMTIPGMSRVILDPRGRLIEFLLVPPAHKTNASSAASWAPLFALAELPMARFTPAPPSTTPPVAADEVRAWTGTMPESALPLRIEAAALEGRPVWFLVAGPWQSETPSDRLTDTGETISDVLRVITLVICALLAFLNLRRGRGDRRGAFRLAAFMFAVHLAALLLRAHHVAGGQELDILATITGHSLVFAAIIALGYLGFEPYVRRYRPDAMISWVRLVHGRVRDALVGRDLLIGTAVGAFIVAVWHFLLAAHPLFGLGKAFPMISPSTMLGATNHLLYYVLWNFTYSARDAITIAMLFAVISALVKRNWLTTLLLYLCVFAVALRIASDAVVVQMANAAIVSALVILTLRYAGILGVAMLAFTGNLYTVIPATLDTHAHFFTRGLLALLVPLTIAVLAFFIALAGRSAIPGENA